MTVTRSLSATDQNEGNAGRAEVDDADLRSGRSVRGSGNRGESAASPEIRIRYRSSSCLTRRLEGDRPDGEKFQELRHSRPSLDAGNASARAVFARKSMARLRIETHTCRRSPAAATFRDESARRAASAHREARGGIQCTTAGRGPVRGSERMNSPRERREVRLRGLGGRTTSRFAIPAVRCQGRGRRGAFPAWFAARRRRFPDPAIYAAHPPHPRERFRARRGRGHASAPSPQKGTASWPRRSCRAPTSPSVTRG
jgi:hypothetical protein